MDFGLSKGRPKALSQINEAVTPEERLKNCCISKQNICRKIMGRIRDHVDCEL